VNFGCFDSGFQDNSSSETMDEPDKAKISRLQAQTDEFILQENKKLSWKM